MHRTTLLIPDDLWEDVQRVADEKGISASQFIREATLAIIYFEKGQYAAGAPLERARKELRK